MSHTRSVETYAEELRVGNREGRFGWSLQLSSTNCAQENLAQLEATLRTLGEHRSVQQVMDELDPSGLSNFGSISFSERLDRLSKEFQRDIQDAHGEKFPSLTESTRVIFLPTSESTAYCLSADDDGHEINGHLICLHEGLYFSAQLLGKVLVYCSLNGDYEQYRQSGEQAFKAAGDFYISPDVQDLKEMFFHSVPVEVNGSLCAMQSKVAMMMMQFVLDHEFGHIANGDLAIQEFNRRYIVGLDEKNEMKQAQFVSWEMEFAADKFALNSLLKRSSSGYSACANFITICLLFLWLEQLELRMHSNESKTHPPASVRLIRLEKIIQELIPDWQEVSTVLSKLKKMIASWGSSENTI